MARRSYSAVFVLLFPFLSLSASLNADIVEDALAGRIGNGTTDDGIGALTAYLDEHPDDDRALFGLGLMQLLHGWERISQGLYSYGAGGPLANSAGFILPVAGAIPRNPEPNPVTIEDVRKMFHDGLRYLQAADETLSKVDDDFSCRADILAIRLDFDGNGKASDRETVLGVLSTTQIRLRNPETRAQMTELFVDFDRGDAEWLRGYCDLSMAFNEFILAHDLSELFNKAGHVFFPKPITEYSYLHAGKSLFEQERAFTGGIDPVDIVAFIHLLRFPVIEPDRIENCRSHLLGAIEHSRAMWALYNSETDNSDEWIPNPKQTAALPGASISEDAYSAWIGFLDASEDILEGRTLLPFWRGDGSLGVDINAYAQQPAPFDLILWIQGSAMHPFLKEGDMLDPQVWQDMEDAFNRHSFRHMFWIN